jgi:hypothetical protein
MNCPSKDVVRIFLLRVMDSLHYFRKNNEKQTMPLVIVKLKITFKCNNVNPLFKKFMKNRNVPQQLKNNKINHIKIVIYPYRPSIIVFIRRNKNIIQCLN